jgi:DNA-binding MarR family transcriptional regulator
MPAASQQSATHILATGGKVHFTSFCAGHGPDTRHFFEFLALTIISIVIKCILMEDNLGAILSDVSRLIRRSFDARARDIGVTRPQWQVLVTLARKEGVNQGHLAELLDVEPITVCRMVDRLSEAGLVERRPDPADRRAWCLFLTPKANEVVEKLRPMGVIMFDEAMEGVNEKERLALMGTLDRIRGNLSRRSSEKLVSNG